MHVLVGSLTSAASKKNISSAIFSSRWGDLSKCPGPHVGYSLALCNHARGVWRKYVLDYLPKINKHGCEWRLPDHGVGGAHETGGRGMYTFDPSASVPMTYKFRADCTGIPAYALSLEIFFLFESSEACRQKTLLHIFNSQQMLCLLKITGGHDNPSQAVHCYTLSARSAGVRG